MRTRRHILGLVLLAVLVVLGSQTLGMDSSMLGRAQLYLKDLPWLGSITVNSWSDVAAVPTIVIPSSIYSAPELLRTAYSHAIYKARMLMVHGQPSEQFEFLPAASDNPALAAVGNYSAEYSSTVLSSVSSDPLAHAAAAATSFDSKILVLLMIVLLLITTPVRQIRTNKALLRQFAEQQQQQQRQQLQQKTGLGRLHEEIEDLQAQLQDLQEENSGLQAQIQAAAVAPPADAAPAEAPIDAVAAVQQVVNFAPAHFATLATLQPVWQLLASKAGPAALEAIRTRDLDQLTILLAAQEVSVEAISRVFGYDQNPTVQGDAMAAKVGTIATFLICLFHMTAKHISAVRECVIDGGMLRDARVRKNGEQLSSFAASCEYIYGKNNASVHRALDPIMLAMFGTTLAVNFNVRNPAFFMIGMLLRAERASM